MVGEIVVKCPKASDFFKSRKIDFCCGGDRPLKKVLSEKGIDEASTLEKLNELYFQTMATETITDWRAISSQEVIKHIEQTHHLFIKEELVQLAPYVRKVKLVHGADHPFLHEIDDLFTAFKDDLLAHTKKEEQSVFPAILAFEQENPGHSREDLAAMIEELEAEHDDSGGILKKIRELTNDYTLPEGACRTFQLVYKRLEGLEEDTFTHIHLENNILFARYSA
ncbi:iron-sulfur cluster repair di-iron protein [Salibacterium aidingense]|uniref:iron-sulfur cluster repair di-iron protein n=1 Tax=Salibacterium aidingense TaxID=384933 RepID=UPI003BED7FCD